MFKLRPFSDYRINSKFILWFLVISLAPLAIATYISYSSSKRILEEEIVNRLRAIADNKTNQIEVYCRQRIEKLEQLSLVSDIGAAIDRFGSALDSAGFDTQRYREASSKFRPMLAYYQRSFGFDDIFLVSQDGEIVFELNNEIKPASIFDVTSSRYSALTGVFIRTAKSLKTQISDFVHYPGTGQTVIFMAAPVLSAGGLSGAVIVKFNKSSFYEFARDYTGLGRTGEIMMAAEIDGEYMFISPPRHSSQPAGFKDDILGLKKGLSLKEVAAANKGVNVFFDYRGKEVMTLWRYLDSFGLGIVVKMDTAEVFASASRLRNILLVVSGLLLVIITVIAVAVAKSISKPIKKLTNTSGIIADGNLSARAQIHTRDEIGELALAFNKMADSLIQAKAKVEQKQAKLTEQKLLLEKMNQELDSFVYTVSHDLRAPLRAIWRFSGFLEEDEADKLGKDSRVNLDNIRKGAKRMTALIEDLLTLSRISRIQNPYEPVNTKDLITEVGENLKLDIKENNVELVIDDNMPVVNCDRIKLREVFLNLVNNAIKFSSKNKSVRPKIQVGCSGKDEAYEFHVKDNGIGIEKEYQKDIFGIFRRLHTDTEYEGTGAGLAIVERIIRDHGGKIWVESEPGKGAAFYFTIPKELKKKKKIGQILLEAGAVSQEELERGLKEQDSE